MLNNNSEISKKVGELVKKAWSDDGFKNKLLSDTKAVLKEHGITFPEHMTVKVFENTDNVSHFILPPKPAEGKFSYANLAMSQGSAVFGGDCNCMLEC